MRRSLTALAAACTAVVLAAAPATARTHHTGRTATLAVIGDTPYGAAQIAGSRATSPRSTPTPPCAA